MKKKVNYWGGQGTHTGFHSARDPREPETVSSKRHRRAHTNKIGAGQGRPAEINWTNLGRNSIPPFPPVDGPGTCGPTNSVSSSRLVLTLFPPRSFRVWKSSASVHSYLTLIRTKDPSSRHETRHRPESNYSEQSMVRRIGSKVVTRANSEPA